MRQVFNSGFKPFIIFQSWLDTSSASTLFKTSSTGEQLQSVSALSPLLGHPVLSGETIKTKKIIQNVQQQLFRNQSKQNALSLLSLLLLILKMVLDATSRISIFSIWMYVSSEGRFSIWKTVGSYYGFALLLFIFNFLYREDKSGYSLLNTIGKIKNIS